MTPTPPLTISEEAREAARKEIIISDPTDPTPTGYFVQTAINQATAKLEEENKALRHQIGTDFMAGVVIEKDQVIAKLEKENVRLKRAFQDEYQKDP
jgi:hypothetical protein